MPQTTYYAIALVVTVAVSLTLAGVAGRRRSVPGGTYFALMMLSGAWWAFTYACEALSNEQSVKIIWAQISYVGIGTMPVFFMLFALNYWRPDIHIRLQYQIMIWLIPVATIIIAATNGLHGILWSEITRSAKNYNILIYGHGPWFYVTVTYFYLTVWVGVVLLFRAATSLSRIYRRQALIVLVASVLPWIANIFFLLGLSPVHGLDMAPIMASATGLLLAFGIVKFQLFKVLPIAKEVVYRQIESGVLVVNDGGTIVDINPAAANMIGGDIEVGQNLEAVLRNKLNIPFPLPMVHQRMEASLDNREKLLWLDVVIAPLHDRRNQLSGYLIMLHDISERKSAEEAQHRLAVIVESSHDAILSKTLDGIITTWNRGAEMLYGYAAEEAIGRSVSILIPSEFPGEMQQLLAKIRRGEAVKDYAAVRINKGKKRINVLLTISPIQDVSGRIIGASTIAQDITELKRAAEIVKESEKKYRDLFENANEAIFVAQNEKLVFINPMLTRMFGYSAAELSAKPFIAFIHPDDREMVIDCHRRRLKGESLPSTYTFRINRKDGSIRWTELSTVVIDWEGKPATLNFLSDITDHRQAEEKVRQVAEEWQTTFDSINDMVSIQDRDYKIIRLNKAYADAVGMKMQDIIGRPCHQVVHNAASHILNCPHHRTIETKKAMTQEVFEPRLGAYLEVSTSPIFDKAGEVIGSVHIAKNISERKRAENLIRVRLSLVEFAAAHSLEELLQKTLDEVGALTESPIGFYHFVDKDQKTLSLQAWSTRTVNEFCKAEGLGMHYGIDKAGVWVDCVRQRQPVIHNDYYSLPHRKGFPEGHAPVVRELVVPIMRGGSIVAILGIGNKPTNYNEIDVEVVSYLADVAWEIAERMRAEGALRESEEKFKDLSEQLPQTIFEIDLEGRFIYANRYGLEFHGYTWDEITKEVNVIDLFVQEQRQRVTENMAKILRGEEYDNHEYSVLRKDGSTYPALMDSNAIVKNGQPVGIRGIIVDITERKKVEQMKSDFVSFISHQLRTPVAGLMAYIDNMLEGITGELNDKQSEYLSEMRGVCARGNQLIADLLNISRIERGVISVNIQPTYLRDKVEIAIREYKTSIEEKGLALNIKEIDQDVSVLADGDKLAEVLKNVLHNAYKFTKAGSISIEISSEGNLGIVKVKDTGIGMTEMVMRDLFKKERVFGGAIATGGGAGLGLYIAKGFMKIQGGDITVESAMGRGSTFIISLPRK
jgi:PAS domain S-box-containing protein